MLASSQDDTNRMNRKARTRATPGERALIAAIRRQASASPSSSLRLGIGDDCAILRARRGFEICVTTDFTLEGSHFRRDWHPPASVGHRCLARGLSDLAAMGAEPVAVFLSIALPARLPSGWFDGFLRGFLALAAEHRAPLAGGDTAESISGLVAADIVAAGQVPAGKGVRRSGARPGDSIYVTGALGGATAELLDLSRKPSSFRGIAPARSGHPHLYPEPRLMVGRRLRSLAHAMIDVSDGLSTDLHHLCEESHVRAVVEEAALPIHPLAMEKANGLQLALHGGEDYELLFTASPERRIPRSIGGVPIHRIGTMRKRFAGQPLVELKTGMGRLEPLPAAGWEHFRPR